jgi:perosamine synthetase
MIKLFAPYVPRPCGSECVKAVLESFSLAQGPRVDFFEKVFRTFFDVKYPVSVNSGTSALEMAYELIGLKKGDEVISTPLTCTATNIPLLRRGVRIVWADILPDTLCIDPKDVRKKLTKKTKAVVQVHLGGVGADVGRLSVPVVSDAAQALGIFTGDYTCCSFQAIKHITTGDGGILVCPDPDDYHKAIRMRWFGIDRNKKIPEGWIGYRERMMTAEPEFPGYKWHMNDIEATLGLVGLRYYDRVIEHRKTLFKIFKSRLGKNKAIKVIDGKRNVYWLLTVLVDRRDDFARLMYVNGIEVNIVQVRNDLYRIFGGKRVDLPVLNRIEDKYVSLPIGMHVSEDEVNYICDIIEKGW